MNSPKRGDIYWINLDPTVGAEIKKPRPCVIISPDAANRSGPLVIVAPITKSQGKRVHFHEVFLPKAASTLQYDSKAREPDCLNEPSV